VERVLLSAAMAARALISACLTCAHDAPRTPPVRVERICAGVSSVDLESAAAVHSILLR
jgi:hypothetical protein